MPLEEGFTQVPSRKQKRRGKYKATQKQPLSIKLSRISSDLDNEEWHGKVISLCLDALKALKWGNISTVVCLGLGSPTDSLNSRVQLVLLQTLCRACHIDLERVLLYDPVFSEEDKLGFQSLSLPVVTDNLNGNYPANESTLFYLPHCELPLYERLIKSNWTHKTLSNILLVANCLQDYADSKPKSEMETLYPCTSRMASMSTTLRLPSSKEYANAFNNIAFQFIDQSRTTLPDESDTEFWKLGH